MAISNVAVASHFNVRVHCAALVVDRRERWLVVDGSCCFGKLWPRSDGRSDASGAFPSQFFEEGARAVSCTLLRS
jgi:hypothetical protein